MKKAIITIAMCVVCLFGGCTVKEKKLYRCVISDESNGYESSISDYSNVVYSPVEPFVKDNMEDRYFTINGMEFVCRYNKSYSMTDIYDILSPNDNEENTIGRISYFSESKKLSQFSFDQQYFEELYDDPSENQLSEEDIKRIAIETAGLFIDDTSKVEAHILCVRNRNSSGFLPVGYELYYFIIGETVDGFILSNHPYIHMYSNGFVTYANFLNIPDEIEKYDLDSIKIDRDKVKESIDAVIKKTYSKEKYKIIDYGIDSQTSPPTIHFEEESVSIMTEVTIELEQKERDGSAYKYKHGVFVHVYLDDIQKAE